uniref:ras association domain-containing protein 4-like isoform X2 n=1 Tax=Myxine glutinosa TaxID=7769 RepID=UPI0035901C76
MQRNSSRRKANPWREACVTHDGVRSELQQLLMVYNTYHKGTPFELITSLDSGRHILEGYLQISWGIRTPLRLQLTDIFNPTSSPSPLSPNRGLSRWLATPDLNSWQDQPSTACREEDGTVMKDEHDTAQAAEGRLIRTQSDVSTIRRPKRRSSAQKKVLQEHRVSVNGHFYNHKTSVFTPVIDCVTCVHVNNKTTAEETIHLLLQKFRIENPAEEFALYIVRANEERRKMLSHECPLVARILEGPCVQVSCFYITEVERAENISHGVAQYINFELHMLKTILEKLAEEEQREANKIATRYKKYAEMIKQRISFLKTGGADKTSKPV